MEKELSRVGRKIMEKELSRVGREWRKSRSRVG